jgi:hypothetical protein
MRLFNVFVFWYKISHNIVIKRRSILKIYEGCKCTYCGSVMFPYHYEPFSATVAFCCPRGCSYGALQGVFNKIPPEFLINILHFFRAKDTDYESKCWNCKKLISSNDPKISRDPIISLGFICRNCNESLRGLMIKMGKITQHPVKVPANPIYINLL